MITDQEAEKACSFIRDNAKNYAKAKAERIYLEQFRKSKKALLVADSSGTVLERESYAYAHTEYQNLLKAWSEAVETEETYRWQLVAAQAKIEMWKTEQYNNRMIDHTHR